MASCGILPASLLQICNERNCVARPATHDNSALSNVGENDLAKRAQGGCASSFAELTRRFRPRLMNVLCSKRNRQICDADDIIQDAFAKAWQSIARYDDGWQVSTWLYTITLRVASDYARKDNRRQKGHAIAQPIIPEEPPETIAARRDEAENLWNVAAAKLSEVHYQAMWLRYGEDLAVQEVARALNRTVIATRVLLHRARTKLQSHFTNPSPAGGSAVVEGESE